jgi:uncharacterized membrane-anchored protein YhcB (DUF1043 family)
MRLLIAFLLGLIIGGVAMLYLPNANRDDLSTQLKRQTATLEAQIKSLADQMKNSKGESKGESGPPPSPTPPASPTPPSQP